MARRKKQYISDDELSASDVSGEEGDEGDFGDFDDEDPDERAERLRFSDPYGRRNGGKRKRDGKEDALYGVFAAGEDEDDGHGSRNGSSRGGRGRGRGGGATHMSKALKR